MELRHDGNTLLVVSLPPHCCCCCGCFLLACFCIHLCNAPAGQVCLFDCIEWLREQLQQWQGDAQAAAAAAAAAPDQQLALHASGGAGSSGSGSDAELGSWQQDDDWDPSLHSVQDSTGQVGCFNSAWGTPASLRAMCRLCGMKLVFGLNRQAVGLGCSSESTRLWQCTMFSEQVVVGWSSKC